MAAGGAIVALEHVLGVGYGAEGVSRKHGRVGVGHQPIYGSGMWRGGCPLLWGQSQVHNCSCAGV